MTIFRCDRLLVCFGLAVVLGGCQSAPTKPIEEIVASNLPDDELGQELSRRLLGLEDDKAAFAKELADAGFKRRVLPYAKECGIWEYPVRDENDPHALRAFVQYCEAGTDEVELRRFGIARHPMTYE